MNFIVYLLGSFFLFSSLANASMIIPQSLDNLYSLSNRVFMGKVTLSQKNTSAENTISQWITQFKVLKAFKNCTDSESIEISQIDAPQTALGQLIPKFNVGDIVYVFLSKESRKGLSSPIALKYGVLKVDVKREVNLSNAAFRLSEAQKKNLFPSSVLDSKSIQSDLKAKYARGNFSLKDMNAYIKKLKAQELK